MKLGKVRIIYFILFVLLAAAEYAIVLWAKGFIRDYVGDILIIPTMYLIFRIFDDEDSVINIYALPLFCYSLGQLCEIVQALELPQRFGLSERSLIGIALGGTGDILDIVGYFAGLMLVGFLLMAEGAARKTWRPWYPIAVYLQWTWGFLQTMAGLYLFLWYINCPHRYYKGVVRIIWPKDGGLSMGMFLFTPWEPEADDHSPEAEERRRYCEEVAVHEYGHAMQSLLLGPLYPFIIGIPSLSWKNIPAFRKLRERKNIPYTWLLSEKWASDWGEKVIGE